MDEKNKLNIDQSAEILGISKRQFSDFSQVRLKLKEFTALQCKWFGYYMKIKRNYKNDKGNSKK